MRTVRIYHPEPLADQAVCELTDDAANHVGRVLRMQVGEPLKIFNGDGYDYSGVIQAVGKKTVTIALHDREFRAVESSLKIHLGQGISRGDRMDFAIQKAVELGVTEITPLFTERCGVKLDAERAEKKREQWQKIVIAACEQSGRAVVPVVHPLVSLSSWLGQATDELKLTLDPWTSATIKGLTPTTALRLVIGPEGGFSDAEVAATTSAGFQAVRLGPRVLRTETAALTAIAALQLQLGDLA